MIQKIFNREVLNESALGIYDPPVKVLIVDDNRTNLEVIGGFLREVECEIAMALSASSALEILSDSTFDIMLLDVMMPGTDGFELCRIIRKMPEHDGVPVIFLTAVEEKWAVVKGFHTGGQDYVTKPFDRDELLERVRTHVELKRSREYFKKMNDVLKVKVAERTAKLQEAMVDLKLANKRLRALDEAKRGFLQIISHELRTPLNGIRGFTEILRESNTDESFENYYDMLDSGIMRLEDFSIMAVDITRLYLNEEHISFGRVDMATVVKNVFDPLQERISEKGLEVVLSKGYKLLCMQGDSDWLIKMFTILLGNAVKHAPRGSRINLNCVGENGILKISITDMGPGFPDWLLNGKLDLFASKDHVDLNMGLQLPMARMIAEAQKGVGKISNNKPKGARVDVQLLQA